jgi:excinuclease ABC subunit C
VNEQLSDKLKQLPAKPGVYFHKDETGKIIYIGKAASLRNRVRQYFQKSRNRDAKTDALVGEIADVDWTEVETELDALFLEAELIRRYMPPYNILLRDDKSLVYVRINHNDAHPTVILTRRPLDDGAKYYGPYFSALTVKKALKYLRRIFPYSTHTNVPTRACLQYHLGLCPGLEESKTSLAAYRKNLSRLAKYLQGKRSQLMIELEKEMKTSAKNLQFEKSAVVRNQLLALKGLSQQVVFGDKEIQDISKDKGLTELADILGLPKPPAVIEGFDISHMQGTNNVASMVVFRAGVPNKSAYRKFKMRIQGNDDFAHMHEALSRRLSIKNRKDWGVPDLFLIDGGKGQLASAIKARDEAGLKMPMIGLAKREEKIIVSVNSNLAPSDKAVSELGGFMQQKLDYFEISMPLSSHCVKLLQRIRDESHRFAVSYHSVLKRHGQTRSWLDEIPTIGPQTRRKLLKTFGSVRGLINARQQDIETVAGPARARILEQYIRAEKRRAKLG